jgi:signal transduction histidine kinase
MRPACDRCCTTFWAKRREIHQARLDQGHVTRGEHGETVFAVCDTGPGISAEDQARVFEAFAQTASVATQPDVEPGSALPSRESWRSPWGGAVTVESIVGVGVEIPIQGVVACSGCSIE